MVRILAEILHKLRTEVEAVFILITTEHTLYIYIYNYICYNNIYVLLSVTCK